MVKSVSVMQDTCFSTCYVRLCALNLLGCMLRSGVSPIDAIANGSQAIYALTVGVLIPALSCTISHTFFASQLIASQSQVKRVLSAVFKKHFN